MRADSSLPVARAVDLSNTAPILKSFDVAAWSPKDSNAVIEVSSLFTTDVSELNVRHLDVRVRRFDQTRSFIERAKSFTINVEVPELQTLYDIELGQALVDYAGRPRVRSLRRALLRDPLVAIHDQELVWAARQRSAHRLDSRVAHRLVPQHHEPVAGLVLCPGWRRGLAG